MSIISIGIPIPNRSALPGQTGGGEEVNLQYITQNYCSDHIPNPISPSVATPTGGSYTFSVTSGGPTLGLVTGDGTVNIQASNPGSYVVTYTVPGVGSANFPINIGAAIDTTITGDSSTCIGFVPSPADLTAVSGYSNYEWFKDNTSVQNGTSNTYTPAFNVAGNFVYKVTITDSSLGIPCTATSSNFTFTVNALPTISIADATGGFCSGSSTTITTTVSAGTVFAWYKDDVLIVGQTGSSLTVSEAGEYTATVTDGNGCTSLPSNGLDIEEFISPTVLITTAPGTTICTGDTATLTANVTGGTGTISYLWSNSDTNQEISVAPTTTTTYTVTVTDDNGCTATASQEITPSTNATAIASINNNAAMSFNGVDSYVDAGDFSSLIGQTVSVSMWFKTTSTFSSNEDLLSFGLQTTSSVSTQRVFFDSSGILVASINNGAGGFATTSYSGLNDGNWHHLACMWEGGSVANGIKIYVDGSLADQASSTQSLTSAVQFIIGENLHYNSNFDGSIDEVAVWNSTLSSCDVKGIYEGSIGGNAGKAANLLDTNTTIPAPVYWNRMGDS